ncbi:SH2 domain-containing adapter protein F isoform X4 [Phocoena sinus]|uniref:SH2 domain-containing adapter protein F isoform X4 n=1 Tax=Phocoena sinus TaxID=42100 RepID=UPI0013C52530|nr:SH2 domain-containing adapter protein F isoform X4 [Phocoena sinus]
MLLSGASPAGSGPGPRAQGSAGGGPAGSRRGAGGAGTGPGGGGSGGVAKWLREHLGFRGGGGGGGGGKPAPPEPDYRPPAPSPAAPPAPPPDILAAYRLQRERDFEDPYSGGPSGSAALATPAVPGPTPPPRHGSPPHRLIRVETPGPPAPPPEERISGPPASSDRLAILEDYADPFDVQETGEGPVGASGAPEKAPENDGYMEPYEAQKMMAEIRGSKETAAQPLPLYDTPYEPEEEEGATPEGEGVSWPRESRLPEDDERPPEEYDQPWEWKKERISKAFAAQFEGSEKSCLSPGREEKGRLPPRLSAGNPKSAKSLSVEPSSPLGEWTDPALPLENQVWYHGAISRTDAENLLRLCKEASYLVRNSETSKNDFSLSLKKKIDSKRYVTCSRPPANKVPRAGSEPSSGQLQEPHCSITQLHPPSSLVWSKARRDTSRAEQSLGPALS